MFPYPFSFLATAESGLDQLDNDYYMEFDGIDDYVRTGGFTLGASFTFSCWINTNVIPANRIIVSSPNYHPPSGTFPGNFILRLTNATTIVFYSYNTTADGEGISATVPTITAGGTWHHIVLTNDGVTAKFYHNGNPLTTTGVNTKTLDDLTNGLDIGDEVNNHNNPWSGYLDEIAVWNTALSATDVEEIYDATETGKCADLSSMTTPPLAWYRMGD